MPMKTWIRDIVPILLDMVGQLIPIVRGQVTTDKPSVLGLTLLTLTLVVLVLLAALSVLALV